MQVYTYTNFLSDVRQSVGWTQQNPSCVIWQNVFMRKIIGFNFAVAFAVF